MVHTGIFATSSEITTKAGDYDTAVFTEAVINALCLQAESVINVMTKVNWSDSYAGLNADIKHILSDAESAWVASNLISGSMGSYGSQRQAETMLDFLHNSFNRDIQVLQEMKYKDFMDGE